MSTCAEQSLRRHSRTGHQPAQDRAIPGGFRVPAYARGREGAPTTLVTACALGTGAERESPPPALLGRPHPPRADRRGRRPHRRHLPRLARPEGGRRVRGRAGFYTSGTLEEVRKHSRRLTPGRYVGAEAHEDDGEPFEEKMKRLVATLWGQQAEAARLDAAIAANLRELGYGG